ARMQRPLRQEHSDDPGDGAVVPIDGVMTRGGARPRAADRARARADAEATMKRIIIFTAVGVALAAGSFGGGAWWSHRSGAAHASAHAATLYTCPMHPDYHSDHPGNCPICGMAIKAVRAESATDGHAARAAALPNGAVQVSPERQQAIGVRLGVVSRSAGSRLLRTTRRAAADENPPHPNGSA